ncbi:hypothetical protein OG579_13765 [Williamsia herbipolensis]|uniref:Uncharacterized protein n=1 Tax=Williamsia herbipolensis TaxID=1603258 RepID=A0AAU4JYF5_9NOCA|nr:hypothetical protein [Williamsia herbipolensis]
MIGENNTPSAGTEPAPADKSEPAGSEPDAAEPQTADAGAWAPAVGVDVIVHPGSDRAVPGVVVHDFGDFRAHAVTANDTTISEPARRWAVQTVEGALVFADTDQLVPPDAE